MFFIKYRKTNFIFIKTQIIAAVEEEIYSKFYIKYGFIVIYDTKKDNRHIFFVIWDRS